MGAAAILAALWLVISFLRPSGRRVTLEWIATVAAYVALFSFFLGRLLEARADGTLPLVIAFGFLCFMFGSGLLVSLWKLLAHLRGATGPGASATH